MIDLLELQPTQISKDLRGYSVAFYGDPKIGKTTIASEFPGALIAAFEKGYAALPGVFAAPINKWTDFTSLIRQLKEDSVKEKFQTIVIDTADIAWDLCEKFICSREDVESIKDVPFGAGYGMVEKEFDEKIRNIVMENYGLVIISHAIDKQFLDDEGKEYNKIVPTLPPRARKVVLRMVDIIGYIRGRESEDGFKRTLYLRGSNRFEAGSRFRFIAPCIELSYDNLVNAIKIAVEAEESARKGSTTEKRNNLYETIETEYKDVVTLRKENKEIIDLILEVGDYKEDVRSILDEFLGKGKKMIECSNTEILQAIQDNIKELLQNIKK